MPNRGFNGPKIHFNKFACRNFERMKFYYFTAALSFILILIFIGGLAQPNFSTSNARKIDSLLAMLPTVNGIDRANTLATLARTTFPFSKDSSLLFSNQAIQQFKKTKSELSLFDFLVAQGLLFCREGEPKVGLKFLWQAKAIKNDSLTKARFFSLYENLGNAYWYSKLNNDSTLYYHQEAQHFTYDLVSKQKNLLALAKDFYVLFGLRLKALGLFFEIEKMTPEKEQNGILAESYFLIGQVYGEDGMSDKSLHFLKKSSELSRKIKEVDRQADAMMGIISFYYNRKLYDSSLAVIKSVETFLSNNKNVGRLLPRKLFLENCKADCLIQLRRIDEAIFVLKGAIESCKDFDNLSSLNLSMAEALRRKGNFGEAELYALKSLELNERIQNWQQGPPNFDVLSKIYAGLNDYKRAYYYSSKRFLAYDSIYQNDTRSKMISLEKEYELAKKDDELKILEANEKLAQQKQLALVIGLIVLAAFFCLLGLFLFIARKRNLALIRANDLITQQAQQIRKVADQKVILFGNISHELRTPITLINGTLEQIKTNPFYTSDNKLEIALRNSRRLKGMVDEIFELARKEQTKEQSITLLDQEIAPILTRIVYSFDTLIEKKLLTLEFNVTALEGVIVSLDEEKFEKIISNLLDNAIKFNVPGGIIRVLCENHLQQNLISISVIDTGVGISPTAQPFVFDRFYQGSSEKTDNGGLGIGLALVKEYTELLGGTVSLSSSPAAGTKVTVALPIATKASNEIGSSNFDFIPDNQLTVSFEALEKPPSILLVEDNSEMQKYIVDIFGNDAKLFCTSDGKEALEWLSHNIPDLVITDLMMPVMDGYEFLQNVKESTNLKHIPVIILTARGTPEDKLYGMGLGIDDYLIKPFNPLELKIRVLNLLSNVKLRSQWRSMSAFEEPTSTENKLSEEEIFLKNVEAYVSAHIGDPTLNIETLARHLAVSDRKLHRICGQLTGMSPGQLIKEVKLKKAYSMLIEKEVTKVTELVLKLGFSDVAYFSKQFYNRFGKRPTEILEEMHV
jgi:signal transduction histidine kinase/DNA-binding response OmpR family regulator